MTRPDLSLAELAALDVMLDRRPDLARLVDVGPLPFPQMPPPMPARKLPTLNSTRGRLMSYPVEIVLADDELAALAESGPEVEARRISIDMPHGCKPPREGMYLVTLGSATGLVGSVYRVESVRFVEPRAAREFKRWALTVLPTPALKAHAVASGGRVWVGGVEGLSLVWYRRDKKLEQ